ncbi:coiled-coil-helix-coiled-coil-helix domain-containing protein [Aspergillus aculeatinus CBS 121060]|uniref:Cytochrome c oxidase assembly protein Cox19 n=1 Tax=Aspergillus aculeatinus CBS 121060 TaxID=1448322 RepID=A0ACD1GS02_9EURO|nr:cytochrome c oxidase assembly protein Cox19 [Aspergillus aculeatinus CBS 121060]RAH63960.1 cytochrome c oxidase assembly protein Cox19 [Aspergillus aculeatinus CBS 121060]
MGFGAPGGAATNYKPTPPERGSFPLDHYGDCKHLISDYLKCLKSNRGVNDDACRQLAKGYLACRMENNLMAPDDFKNLGLTFEKDKAAVAAAPAEGAAAGTENKS